jgi:hypothetical protein
MPSSSEKQWSEAGMQELPGSFPVGITGHRRLRRDGRLEASIDAAIGQIETLAAGEPLAGFSSLAEGADRWVVRRLLARPGVSFTAVLPMPVTLYREDFSNPTSQTEFEQLLQQAAQVIELPVKPDRETAYLEAGRYILARCKVLLAVWDGQPARGVGGTGQVVDEARHLGIPLAWVQPGVGGHTPELHIEGFVR